MPFGLFTFIPFIVYLFWIDLRREKRGSRALWIPFIWMFLAGSRPLSSWLNLGPAFSNAQDLSEGSPLDAAGYMALIAAGVYVLHQRVIDWRGLLRLNFVLILYFGYCLASIMWADEPLVLLKRLTKDMSTPIMALVILTEERPYDSLGIVFRRLAFVLLPLSLMFIFYFPELGRGYRPDGSAMFTGVGRQKNDLGLICLMSGIYAARELVWRQQQDFWRRNKIVGLILLGLLIWLLKFADSQTSIVCLSISAVILLVGHMPFMRGRPNLLLAVFFGVGGGLWLLDDMFDIKGNLLALLGRNPTLTNRTDVWETLKRFEVNPIVGAGFMNFWTGARLDELWRIIGVTINQAHNGYLEQYLNLGYIGVGFIVAILLVGLMRACAHIAEAPADGLLRLSFILSATFYNFTEAAFYGPNNMWLMLLLGCIEVPRAPTLRQMEAVRGTHREVKKYGFASVRIKAQRLKRGVSRAGS